MKRTIILKIEYITESKILVIYQSGVYSTIIPMTVKQLKKQLGKNPNQICLEDISKLKKEWIDFFNNPVAYIKEGKLYVKSQDEIYTDIMESIPEDVVDVQYHATKEDIARKKIMKVKIWLKTRQDKTRQDKTKYI